jgi:hypothetical protein
MKMLGTRVFRAARADLIFRTVISATAAMAAFLASGMQVASAYECKSIMGRCMAQVGGWCEPTPRGERAHAYDKNGHVAAFEACMSREAKARGLRDPYAPASASASSKQKPAAKR